MLVLVLTIINSVGYFFTGNILVHFIISIILLGLSIKGSRQNKTTSIISLIINIIVAHILGGMLILMMVGWLIVHLLGLDQLP